MDAFESNQHKRNSNREGRKRSRAKACPNKHRHEGYANAQEQLSAVRAFLNAYKLEQGCAWCGYKKHPMALDFDHIRGEKRFSLGTNLQKLIHRIDDILEEMNKCQILCANCHRIKTAQERGLLVETEF